MLEGSGCALWATWETLMSFSFSSVYPFRVNIAFLEPFIRKSHRLRIALLGEFSGKLKYFRKSLRIMEEAWDLNPGPYSTLHWPSFGSGTSNMAHYLHRLA